MEVVLIFPRMKYVSGDPPLGLAYIAAQLRAKLDVNVSILDTTFNHSFDHIRKSLDAEKPDVVGMYIDTLMYGDGIKVAKICKDLDIPVISGGPHSTILPETVVNHVDAVCIGEGEETMTEIIERLESNNSLKGIKGICYKDDGKVIMEERRPPITDLDSLAFPALDLIDMEKYMENWHLFDSVNTDIKGTNLIATRGCPFNCSFCQPTLRELFGNKIRTRSPENVIQEIKKLKDDYKIDAFYFQDDTLTVFKKWVQTFCEEMKKEDLGLVWGCNTRIDTMNQELMKTMYDAGLRVYHIGIESGSQRILDTVYQKGIQVCDVSKRIKSARSIGIHTLGFFMLGAPTETYSEVKETIKFACSLDLNEVTFSITTPLPKTHLYDLLREKSINLSDNYDDYDYYKRRAFEDGLTFDEIKKLQKEAFMSFYLHPKRWPYILNHITSRKGLSKMFTKLKRVV